MCKHLVAQQINFPDMMDPDELKLWTLIYFLPDY